jgi:hypothetical protein
MGSIGASSLTRTHTAIVGALCALSVVGASASRRTQITEQAVLYTGQDFGVRVYEAKKGSRPQATPVIRINSRWHEVDVELNAWTGAHDTAQRAVLYAGPDFGVRVRTPTDGNPPLATPMIRINGRWQRVQLETWGDARALMQRPVVYSGEDFGVRVSTPTTSSQAVATPVIRINGKWQAVELKPGPAK